MSTIAPSYSDSLPERLCRLDDSRPGFLDAARFLLLGPNLTLHLQLAAPDALTLADFLRCVRDNYPNLLSRVRPLAESSPAGEEALLEFAVDDLLDADFDWPHPAIVLDRPGPAYEDLLRACLARRTSDPSKQHPKLDDVAAKLTMAVRIAREARARRQRLERPRTSRKQTR